MLLKVFADLKKVFSLKWDVYHGKPFFDEEGSAPTDPAVRLMVEFIVGMSAGQEGIVLRIKWQTQDFWSQQK